MLTVLLLVECRVIIEELPEDGRGGVIGRTTKAADGTAADSDRKVAAREFRIAFYIQPYQVQ